MMSWRGTTEWFWRHGTWVGVSFAMDLIVAWKYRERLLQRFVAVWDITNKEKQNKTKQKKQQQQKTTTKNKTKRRKNLPNIFLNKTE